MYYIIAGIYIMLGCIVGATAPSLLAWFISMIFIIIAEWYALQSVYETKQKYNFNADEYKHL